MKKILLKKFTSIPNLITLSRFVFGILVFLAIVTYHNYLAFTLYTIGALTDALDGYMARKNKETTNIGSFLDALADRFFISIVVIALIIARDLTMPLKILFLIWIITESIFAFIITRKIHKFYLYAVHRNSIRMTAVFVFIAIGWVIIEWPYLKFFVYIIILLSILTIADYLLWILGRRK